MASAINRSFTIVDGKDERTVIALCPHCAEPFTIEGKPPNNLLEDDSHLKFKSYCRGANGLSWNIRCCKILNCLAKNKVECNLNPAIPGSEYPVSKQWNTIVEEPINV